MSQIQILITLATCMFVGLLITRIFRRLSPPDVTSYLVGGVLIGSYVLGNFIVGGYAFGFNDKVAPVGSFEIISSVALGFIAFDIGNEFRLSDLKKTGKQATVIGILQALAATALVDVALIGLHFILKSSTGEDILPIPACIILGAIATATAPAATLMVVRQYKAKGPLTNILLPVVALDDAVGLVVFAVSFGIAKSLYSGSVDVLSIIVEPLCEIILSLVLGAVLGFILSYVESLFHSRSNRLSLMITFVFVAVAVSMIKFNVGGFHIGFSSLLTCMMLGTVFCNVCDYSIEMMERVERWTKPLFLLFFVISGAHLDLTVFKKPLFVLVGAIYILARSLGKYFGARGSAKMVKCDNTIVNYLGITLLPQAGVALGRSFSTRSVCSTSTLSSTSELLSVTVS